MKTQAAVLLCLAAPSGLAARQATSIMTARILDGRGAIIENTTIMIRDGRIDGLVPNGAAATHDLSNLTVLPGGIDTHVHIGWHFDADGKTHDATREEESEAQAALYAVENAYQTLMGGITTVQSLGASVDRDLRDWIAHGVIPGPRILTSLRSIGEDTGSPDEIRAAVAQRADAGADVIKLFASASIRSGGTPTMTQEQLDAACGEASRRGLRTAVHAHGPESARRAIMAGCTAIEHGALLDAATLDLMVEHGTYYDPNIGLIFQNYLHDSRDRYLGIGGYTEEGFAHMERAVGSSLAVFRMGLERPGLKMVFGTDAVAGAHGRNFEELIYRVQQGGQEPMAAIVSATSLAAESMRLDDVGVIAPGMWADIIAVDGNPLEDITALRRVVFVMKAGKVFKN